MLDLRDIEFNIRCQLEASTRDKLADKNLIALLDLIRLHLEDYRRSANPAYLLDILRLIESVNMSELSRSLGLFSSKDSAVTHMRAILSRNRFAVVTKPEELAAIRQKNGIQELYLSMHAERVIGFIYQTIKQRFPIANIAWDVSLPKNDDGEIINREIHSWQQHMQTIVSPQQAVRDYRRDTRLDNVDPVTLKSDEDVIKLVNNLVEKSNIAQERKNLVKQWLLAKGGQEMNFYINDIMRNQSLFLVPNSMVLDPANTIISTRSDSTCNNWSLNENGDIVYHQTVHIKSINNGSFRILSTTDNHGIKVMTDKDPDYEKALLGKAKQYLATINSHVILTIVDGKVIPKVQSLDIISQTNLIRPIHSVRRAELDASAPATATAAAAAAAICSQLNRPHSSHF